MVIHCMNKNYVIELIVSLLCHCIKMVVVL